MPRHVFLHTTVTIEDRRLRTDETETEDSRTWD